MHLSPAPPTPPGVTVAETQPQTPLPATPASPEDYTPVPPNPTARSRKPTRTEKKTARQQWKTDGSALSARLKAAESECRTAQRRFCPSFVATVEAAREDYRRSIGRLRGHARTAREALEAMSGAARSDGKDFKELNKRCEAAVESYERDVQAVAEKVRCEGVRLDREVRELTTFAEAALEKFCRWERGAKDQNFVEGNASHEVIVPMATALEMKEMTGGEEKAKTIERKESKLRAISSKAQGFKMKIAKIDRLIAADGGKTAHWQVEEQTAFLKAWTRCGGDVETIVKAVREHAIALKGRSDSELVSHAAWYVVYLSRLKEKKELTEEWRAWKNAEREKKVKEGLREMDEKVKGEESQKPRLSKEEVREAQRKQKEAIQAWKEEKEREKENERAEQIRLEEEERLRWEKQQEKHRFLRARVNDYKAQKEQDEERMKKIKAMADRSNAPRAFTREEIEKKREDEIKRAKERRKLKERQEREKQFEAARIRGTTKGKFENVPRDFNRLTGNTKASDARAYSNEELDDLDEGKKRRRAHEKPVFYNARDLAIGSGRRAVPTWRAGV
mmetsp:Transcript_27190/g.54283  ORF Transcript_27190/g.54283 Transcript_27190/m.54283 type:complete len:564 (+) Transcript_27190:185-1876(+)